MVETSQNKKKQQRCGDMEYPNVIFIVIDTLREDYSRPLKEKLTKFDFIVYENTVAPAPWTVPSHASIFTGLYPLLHKTHETKGKKGLDIQLKYDNLLSTTLLNLEYDTYLLTANPYVRPSLGFIGFNQFYETPGWGPRISLLSHDDLVVLAKLKSELNNSMTKVVKTLLLENPSLLLKGGISKLIFPLNSVYTKMILSG